MHMQYGHSGRQNLRLTLDHLALGEVVLKVSRAERPVGVLEVPVVGAEGGGRVAEETRTLGDTRV